MSKTLMKEHFADLARSYEEVRLTDLEPVIAIRNFLKRGSGPATGIDVGCGSGRYTRLLENHLGPWLTIAGADTSQEMLDVLATSSPGIPTICGDAESLPLPDGEFDFITTFNAVHHFDIPRFFDEARRLLKPDGLLFIYTRTPDQNARTIWGQCFPMFCQVETRLRDASYFMALAINRGFGIADIRVFRYHRVASLLDLVHRARSYSYSTFRLIPADLFEPCLVAFTRILRHAYGNPAMNLNFIKWIDSNLLLVFRKLKEGE